MSKTKVSVIGGAGFVGESVGWALVRNEVADEVVLVDIIEDKPQGKALDMKEASPIVGADCNIYGTNNYEDLKDSNIVVVTAGLPRKPGMDRMDLLQKNIAIAQAVTENIKKYAPDAFIIYVANPVDVLTYTAFVKSGFAKNKVMGMAGILDTARYRAFISMEANVSVKDIRAMVLGGHGDSMVPLTGHTSIGGLPLKEFLSQDKIDAIVQRTKTGGGEIVKLLKTGSAYYAPGKAVAEMVEAILKDQKRVLPVIAHFDGQYGFEGIFAGAPVILGKDGVEKIIEIELNDADKEAYRVSLQHVKDGIEAAKQFIK